jgi:hypothetical protein
MAQPLKCPNKSAGEWKTLVKALGSEEDAYLAYFRAGDKIPSIDQARDLLGISSSKTLAEQEQAKLIQAQFIDQAREAHWISPRVQREQKAHLSGGVGAAVATQNYLEGKGVDPIDANWRAHAKLRGPQAEYTQRYASIREPVGEENIKTWQRAIVHDEDIPWLNRRKLVEIVDKLADGTYLANWEADLFGQTFGPEAADVAQKYVPLGDKFWTALMDLVGIPRTMYASMDMSGIGRQARALGQAHPKEYAAAMKKYVETFWSEESAQKLEALVRGDPRYQDAVDAGLQMPLWGNVSEDIANLEEEYAFTKYIARFPGVRPSERSFVTVLNWLRLTIFDKVVTQTEIARGREMSLQEKTNLAKSINHLSGRANLIGGNTARNMAILMNALFFSPRFVLSRLALPVDFTMASVRSLAERTYDPATGKAKVHWRLEAQPELRLLARATASMMATNLALMMLMKLLWGDEVDFEMDGRSADFGKVRIGNMRIDPWAGYQQSARFLWRMASGETKTASGEIREQSRWDTFWDFMASKASPMAALMRDLYEGQDRLGRPLLEGPQGKPGEALDELGVPEWMQGLGKQAWNRAMPGAIQDATDALLVEGVPQAFTMGTIAFFGGGAQTYETSGNQQAAIARNDVAQKAYRRPWNDLKPSQQQSLRRQHKEIAELELQGKREAPPVLKFDNTERLNTHKRIYATLSPQVQTALNEADQSVAIERRIGKDFYLNSSRYAEYEKRAGRAIEASMTRLVQMSAYREAPATTRKLIVERVVQKAKLAARTSILVDTERGKL